MALINMSFFCMRVLARKFEFIVILSSSISLLRERISFLQQSQQLLLAGGNSGVLDRDISSLIINTLVDSNRIIRLVVDFLYKFEVVDYS